MQLPIFEAEKKVERARYRVLISPPPAVISAVRGLKQRLHAEIGLDDMNRRALAHISLGTVETAEGDAFVTAAVTRAVSHLYCFDIELNGADIFTHGKTTATLYLKIERPEPVRRVFEAIAEILGGENKTHTTFRLTERLTGNTGMMPHVTIAKSVPQAKLQTVNAASYDYFHQFVCDRITILKWGGGRYEVIHEAPLQPLQGVRG